MTEDERQDLDLLDRFGDDDRLELPPSDVPDAMDRALNNGWMRLIDVRAGSSPFAWGFGTARVLNRVFAIMPPGWERRSQLRELRAQHRGQENFRSS